MRVIESSQGSGPYLGREAYVVVPDEARVGVVLDVLALYVVLQVEDGLAGPAGDLNHTHLHDVHLHTQSVGFEWRTKHPHFSKSPGPLSKFVFNTLSRCELGSIHSTMHSFYI